MIAVHTDQHAAGATRDLRHEPRPLGVVARDGVELLAPELRRASRLNHQEGDLCARLLRDVGKELEFTENHRLVGAGFTRRHDFEETAPRFLLRPGESHQLINAREGPRDQLSVQRLVIQRARGREAHSPRRDRFTDVHRHLLDVFGGGRLVAFSAIAHDVETDRCVRNERGDVQRVLAPVERIEIFREGLPGPVDPLVQRRPRDVLDALHHLDEPLLVPRSNGRKADTAVAGDHGRHAMAGGGVEQAVPGRLTIVMRVDVHETRRDDQPGSVQGFPRLALDVRADRDDQAVRHRDVAPKRRGSRPVDDRPTGNLQIEHGAS